MEDWIRKIAAIWQKEPGASALSIQTAEQALNVTFPYDYHQFLLWSDGGEGWNDIAYVSLWSSSELPSLNSDYKIRHYLPDVVGVGTDGGNIAYGFQFKSLELPVFVRFSLGDLAPEAITVVAPHFYTGMLLLFALE